MSKKVSSPTVTSHLSLILSIISLAVALLALAYVVNLQSSWTQIGDSQMQNQVQAHREQARLRFCHDNNIRPCDDDPIREFNRTVDESKTFPLNY